MSYVAIKSDNAHKVQSAKFNPSMLELLDPSVLKSDAGRVENVIFKNVQYYQSIIDTLGVLVTVDEIKGMNQKARVHTARTLRFICSGGLDLQCFDRASAFCAAIICSTAQRRIAFKDVHYVLGATGEGTAPISGVSRSKLRAIITGYTTNAGTISTQTSRSVGEHGLFTACGVVEKRKGDKEGFTMVPEMRNHPFLLSYAMTLNSLSEKTLIDMMSIEE